MAGIFSSKGASDNLQLLTKKGQAFKAGNEYQTEVTKIEVLQEYNKIHVKMKKTPPNTIK